MRQGFKPADALTVWVDRGVGVGAGLSCMQNFIPNHGACMENFNPNRRPALLAKYKLSIFANYIRRGTAEPGWF